METNHNTQPAYGTTEMLERTGAFVARVEGETYGSVEVFDCGNFAEIYNADGFTIGVVDYTTLTVLTLRNGYEYTVQSFGI